MILTSYYANYRNFTKGYKRVSISLFSPPNAQLDSFASELAPTSFILSDYKNKKINDEEYIKRYFKEVLSKLDPKDIAIKYDNSIFLCYEKKGSFCHRNIVADWLNKAGFKCSEI